MKIIYKANDGVDFNTEQECLKHESTLITLKDIVGGQRFVGPYTGSVIVLIEICNGLFLFGGNCHNDFKTYSDGVSYDLTKPSGLTKQQVLDLVISGGYKKG